MGGLGLDDPAGCSRPCCCCSISALAYRKGGEGDQQLSGSEGPNPQQGSLPANLILQLVLLIINSGGSGDREMLAAGAAGGAHVDEV